MSKCSPRKAANPRSVLCAGARGRAFALAATRWVVQGRRRHSERLYTRSVVGSCQLFSACGATGSDEGPF